MSITILDVIRAKRDGRRLTDDQIDWFIEAYTRGEVADEQASALLMAIVWRGMEPDELARWTRAMLASGERLDLGNVGRPTVDKHSTGGVGDKVSLILCPLAAACGLAVPQLSGRGLGHTGGTLDKMESIPGWDANVSPDRMRQILTHTGCVIAAAGSGLVPADRKMYALRDVTATVESIPLIASSIMSKKIAEGTEALVLDVKVGSGAFLPNIAQARELSHTMVGLGERHGVKTSALLTAMDTPLGRAVGNAVEVTESVEVLAGGGPPDVIEVTVALAELMVELARVDADPGEILRTGQAMDVWRDMVRAQDGDPDAALPVADERDFVTAERSGHVSRLDARAVGEAAWRLGAGRARKEDPVSAAAGVICRAKPGEKVTKGDVVLELHADTNERFAAASDALATAIEIDQAAPESPPLVLERI